MPHLPLDVFRPTWLAETLGSHAVLDANRVVAMTRGAREAGVRMGMRRAGVGAIAPDVLLTDRDPAREEAAMQGLALTLLRFTPQVARLSADTVAIDVSASLRLFGGLRALLRLVAGDVAGLGLTARISVAPTAAGASLLAQQPVAPGVRRRVAQLRHLSRALDRLPLALLPETRRFAAWIEGVGCQTLGDLRRLPRAGLKRRCGEALLDAMDRAYGECPESFEWERAPLTFAGMVELPDRIEHAEALLFAGRRLLLQMAGWLAAQQKAVAQYVLLLEHERGREAIEPTAVPVALAQPSWDPEHLVRLLKERLGRLTLPAPVIVVRLAADDVREREPESDSLFPDTGGKPGDFERMVELLTARLGAENVLQFAVSPDHRPERANEWAPLGAGKPAKTPETTDLPERPFWLLDEPVLLITRNHRPFYGSALRLARKPERIEAGWFDDQLITRDYFVGVASDHSRYWVYRERIGSQEDQDGRWFLHGLFG